MERFGMEVRRLSRFECQAGMSATRRNTFTISW